MASLSACAGKEIHSNLSDDPRVATRQWALQTRKSFEAGEIGTEFSTPVFYENTLLFGSREAGLTSLYPGLMLTRWNLPIPNGVASDLSVQGTSAYFVGGDGYLYSVNAENGRVNWRYDLHNPIASRPVFEGGRLFVTTSDDTVFAFDAGTGKWLWHYRRRSSPVATIHGASAPLVDGNDVLVGMSDGYLVALSVQDGQLRWEKRLHQGTRFTDVDAHPVLSEGILYVPSYDGSLYALRRTGGEILWRFDAGASHQVVVEEGKIYLPSSDGNVYVLQKANGKVLWKFELDRGVPTKLALTDRYVIFGSSHQYLYVVDKASGQGAYRWNAGWGSGFSSGPAYDSTKQRFYLLSRAGNLYAWSLTPLPRKVRPRGETSGYRFF